MAEIRKFMFDTEFDASRVCGAAGASTSDMPESRHITAARKDGFEAGRQAGRLEAEAEAARLEAEALSRIASEIGVLGQRHAATLTSLRQDTLGLAHSIGRKLAQRLIAVQPLAEIEGVVEDCMQRLLGEARLVVRVHADQLDVLQKRVEILARRTGFAGQVILLAEDDIGLGDCRVEWADGGATRNVSQLEGEIDALIARALGVRSAADEAPTS